MPFLEVPHIALTWICGFLLHAAQLTQSSILWVMVYAEEIYDHHTMTFDAYA